MQMDVAYNNLFYVLLFFLVYGVLERDSGQLYTCRRKQNCQIARKHWSCAPEETRPETEPFRGISFILYDIL